MAARDAGSADAPIETDRLSIRPFQESDASAAAELWRSALDHELRSESLTWLAGNPRELAGLGQAPFGDRAVCLRDTDRLIGIAGLVAQPGPFALLEDPAADDSVWTLEVGLYWCTHPDHRGRGYAAEAGRAMAHLGASVMRVQRVIAFTQQDNLASQRVMHRLGMTMHELRSDSAPWMQVVGTLSVTE